MPRYNTVNTTFSTTTNTSLGTPASGLFTKFTGTAPYTVTLASPVVFLGQMQTFYNATAGTVTVSTPSGVITGPGGGGAATFGVVTGTVIQLISDGTNYILVDNLGGALSATTATFSSTITGSPVNANVVFSPTGTGTVTISPAGGLTVNPTTTGTINNTSIGASTRSTGAFTTLAANNAVTFTQGTNASSTTNATLVVTGGIGVSQDIRVGGTTYSALTGDVSGNITSGGTSSFSGTTTVTGTFTYGGSTVVTVATRPALGTNAIVRTNSQTISEAITIPAGTSGMTAGPVTIASGQTVTVNGDWSII